MPCATGRDPIYRGRRFSVDVIELCVRWYLTYRLSYRNLAAMMAERGVAVTHTTIMRSTGSSNIVVVLFATLGLRPQQAVGAPVCSALDRTGFRWLMTRSPERLWARLSLTC